MQIPARNVNRTVTSEMHQRIFTEFDAYEDTIQHADVQMTPRRRDQSRWVVGAMSVGGLHLQWGIAGGSMVTTGEISPGGHALFVPLNRCTVNVVNGQRLDDGSLMVAASGSEFCIRADGWNEWFSLFVPQPAAADEERSSANRRPPECRVAQVGRQRLNRIRRVIKSLVGSPIGDEETHPAESRFGVRALHELAACSIPMRQRTSERGRGRPMVDRREILQMMEDPISGSAKPPCVSELASSAAVSERTLRRAFHKWIGTSPARYARLRRFHVLRDALLAADPAATNVSSVLASFGILDFGRFAGAYRALFGELPSQTIRRGERYSRKIVAFTPRR